MWIYICQNVFKLKMTVYSVLINTHTHIYIYMCVYIYIYMCVYIYILYILYIYIYIYSIRVFFTDTDDGTIFYHSTTFIETFIFNFACEMTTRIFNCNACVCQTATRWDLPPYRIIIWVIDWWCNVCLFTWWIDTRSLLQRIGIGNWWI